MAQKDLCDSLDQLVSLHDPWYCCTPAYCEAYLLQRCPEEQDAIALLILALEYEIVSEMRRLQHSFPASVLLPKLSRWLVSRSGTEPAQATWAVERWATAFGILTATEAQT